MPSHWIRWFLSVSVCHAELNAVLNKNTANVKNARIYVALFPCNECAKIVIQSGIREIIYYSDKYAAKDEFKASRRMLNLAGVKLRFVYYFVFIILFFWNNYILFSLLDIHGIKGQGNRQEMRRNLHSRNVSGFINNFAFPIDVKSKFKTF